MSPANVYATVNTAYIEGQVENVLERQKELSAMHHQVQKKQDLNSTPESSEQEVNLVLSTIKLLYDDLDLPDALAKEKLIKTGKRLPKRLVPLGPTLIVPTDCCPVSSTLTPLAGAVAAGSPAVILAPMSPVVRKVLAEIIHDSLDREAFRMDSHYGEKGTKLIEIDATHMRKSILSELRDLLLEGNEYVKGITLDRGERTLNARRELIELLRLSRYYPQTLSMQSLELRFKYLCRCQMPDPKLESSLDYKRARLTSLGDNGCLFSSKV
ncbi:uncharacterized protein Z518_00734 [Rhinocladiella mackenziei CBS 650.93]|uniref:Aldehyde dehydrogenase domain-containing protein n=1 Tax=Rhinocladiella mackenziei CBS 650.93 TaxID=1442369 RepID=A0A0D2HG67_9EURO|nr:uncharacterized protein Z518_00734 [Rhinocladiella mackenziei CBS 650.93]KIX09653.1 hypothetical protein Z518_00734 [Rhinocladiella mackenziei CBS 650.93]